MITSITARQLLLPFLISFLISYLLTPIVRRWAVKHQFIDQPNRQHPGILHHHPIPRTGGIAMFIAFFVTSLLFAQFDLLLGGIILGGLVNVVVGTLDDKYDLPPLPRLIVQIATGVILVIAGVSFYTSNPFGEGVLFFDNLHFNLPILNQAIVLPADLILIFWVVWLMNTTNWTKGVSQLPGVAVTAFLTLAGVALQYQAGNPYQAQTALLAVVSAGAVLAFLPFNFPPEKMFPGFGASTWIGFNLAVLSVLSGGKVAALLIVFALPVIDALLVGIKRVITGHNPLIHDREHIYHFLLDAGMTKRQIIYLYWLTSFLFGLTALTTHTLGKLIAITSLTAVISIFFVYLYWRKRKASQITQPPG